MTDEQILALVRKIRSKGRVLWGAFLAVLNELAKDDMR
jgi:hypothetical protein